MSNKLSQTEIDALVASLIASGDAPQAQPTQTDTSGAAPAPGPEDQSGNPADAPAAASAAAAFEEIVGLGPITPAEVEAASAAFQAAKAGGAADSGQPATGPALTPTPAPAAAVPSPEAPIAAAPSPASPAPAEAAPVKPAPAQPRAARPIPALKGVLLDIELTVTVELGRARLSLGDVLEMGPGSVITLDKLANTPLNVKINGLPAMTAEVLAIGEKYGIRIVDSNVKVQAVAS